VLRCPLQFHVCLSFDVIVMLLHQNFDRQVRERDFKEGDQVLLWDKIIEKLGMHPKFDNVWLGPYKIEEISGLDSFYFSMMEGKRIPLRINVPLLKHYFQGGT
jgi:hypothetical protein